ncbi:15-methylpalmitoyl-4-hydroxy-2-pyrone 4-O-methyltransferase [Halobacillus karajensis]|uniref:isoprenylcysteine carboxyl methyltransferase family protein n=1 Tax=Halobacillus karajensis TaxID=195088 RepID=UPI0008A76551|nr:isoprenylcysteine carboxylmethyltransferase family protein [Halobacillus karajensis]SEH80390.1 15-methylpalmitoyl-4-hydroxy-2-pyrone 4-O-methyltransferase [Halobacillus karajensis]
MEIFLWMIFSFIIFQRLGELVLASRNRKWMLKRGAREWGQGHYFLFILLHTAFFMAIIIEFVWTSFQQQPLFYPALAIFLTLQVLRMACIKTLGKRWNTRILVMPEEKPIRKGIYRYIKHPNYVIVFFEMMVIPVLFHAYLTALVFPFLHLLLLTIRIPVEEKALEDRA